MNQKNSSTTSSSPIRDDQERSKASSHSTTEASVFAWIATGMLDRSLPNTEEAARWRVLLAAFWDATRDGVFPEQERRPDRPQWDIVSLRSALENWGRHHDWCAERVAFRVPAPCDCGYSEALKIGQYATLDPNGYGYEA